MVNHKTLRDYSIFSANRNHEVRIKLLQYLNKLDGSIEDNLVYLCQRNMLDFYYLWKFLDNKVFVSEALLARLEFVMSNAGLNESNREGV